MSDLKNYSPNSYYQFSFLKSDYVLLSSILHSTYGVFIKYKASWPSGSSSDWLDKKISDLNELVCQLELQVERQQFFDSKGI